MIATTLSLLLTTQLYGQPTVARFYGGAKGAVSLQFDDSMVSQLKNAVPELNKRRIRATFFINPGRDDYPPHRHEWEVELPAAGHEMANHTMHHNGAKTTTELEKEINDCSDVLDKIPGRHPRLASFGSPGGVPFDFTPNDLQSFLASRCLVISTERYFFDEKTKDPVDFAKQAESEGRWMQIGMHGVGGQWLSTSVPTLNRLLDHLFSHKDAVWTAPTIEVWKYIQERNAIKSLNLVTASRKGFTLDVTLDATKLRSYSHRIDELYDQPLTVEVEVPSTWTRCTVQQGRMRVTTAVNSKSLLVNVVPGQGQVRVSRVD